MIGRCRGGRSSSEDIASKRKTYEASGSAHGTSTAVASAETVQRSRSVPQTVAVGVADSEKAGVDGTVTRESVDNSDAVIEAILEEASDDPKVVLIRLSLEIEKELRFLLGRAGFLPDRDYLPLRKAVETLWHEWRGR